MGLREKQGELQITKSGRGVKFVDKSHPAWNSFFVASKEKVEELLRGDRAWVDFALVVGDHEGE